jgi:hypothetical protein
LLASIAEPPLTLLEREDGIEQVVAPKIGPQDVGEFEMRSSPLVRISRSGSGRSAVHRYWEKRSVESSSLDRLPACISRRQFWTA